MAQDGGIIGPIRIRSTDEKHEPPRFAADRPEDELGDGEDPLAELPENSQQEEDPFMPVRDVVQMSSVERAALAPGAPLATEGIVPMVLSDAFDPEPPVGPDGVEIDLDELWFKRHQKMLEASFEPMRKSLEAEGEISLRLGYNPPLMLEPNLNDQVFSSLRKLIGILNGGADNEAE